ncbi:MAG: iron-containing alcohol dehydrogenase [Thalassovita sp.]
MTATGILNFTKQEKMVFGFPASDALLDQVTTGGHNRVFITTNRSLSASELISEITCKLGDRCVGIYSEISAHSPQEAVLEATSEARAAKADVIVGVGGGSVIDATKVVLGCLWDNVSDVTGLDQLAQDGPKNSKAPNAIRMISIPTTLSAAEFTPLAGITDRSTQTKRLFLDPLYTPACVIFDPEATLSAPQWLFLSTGIRGVDHCVETWLSSRPSAYGDALSREGLRRITPALRAVHADPKNLDARLECQLATFLAISGPVGGVPVGASHGIGRVLGGAFNVAHGHTSCALLPAVLDWNSAEDDGRQKDVVTLMGADSGTTASQAVAALVSDLDLPGTLQDLDIRRDQFDLIVDRSLVMLADGTTSGNQRAVTSGDQILEILERAY